MGIRNTVYSSVSDKGPRRDQMDIEQSIYQHLWKSTPATQEFGILQ